MRVIGLSLFLFAFTVTISRSDRATFDETKTQVALFLDQAPTIDGAIDATEWARASSWEITVDPNLTDGIRGGANGDGAVNPPVDNNDLSYRIYVGYDTNNLYIAVRVKDDIIQDDSAEADSANGNTWMDDSVEIFIDGDNSNFETRDTSGTNPEVVGTGGQYVITVNNAYREAEAGNPGYGSGAAWYAKTTRTDTGYDAEFRISLATIGNPKPGDIIGFTVGVNDDDDGGGGERQVVWVGRPHTEATYGNLVIGGKSYSAPKTAAPTIDGKINAAEYASATEIKVDTFNAIYDLPSGDDAWETTDHGFSAWVVHDADAIYVAVDVKDDLLVNDTAAAGSENQNTWEDDSVEIFFDGDHDHDGQWRAGENEPFEGQYVFTANGAWRHNEANNPKFGASDDWYAATTKTAAGFQVEFKVKKAAILSPADNSTIGFHIAVNDDDGSTPAPKTQYGWSGTAHVEYTYGHLTLSAPISGGNLKISGAKVNGNNLELLVATSNAASTHVVHQSSELAPTQWTPVSNVTWTPGQGGLLTAAFPKPPGPRMFYRVAIP